jgi:hypothetical protein
MLPVISPEDLTTVRVSGWARVGIVAAIIDDRDRLLMLDHHPNDKLAESALGPLAETSQAFRDEGNLHIESAVQTLARGIREELGLADPGTLDLQAQPVGAWITSTWPVGDRHEQQQALAICPIVHIGPRQREALLDTFKPTEEIQAVRFINPADIVAEHRTRPGTAAWLGNVMASRLLWQPRQRRTSVMLPTGPVRSHGQDIRFDRIAT